MSEYLVAYTSHVDIIYKKGGTKEEAVQYAKSVEDELVSTDYSYLLRYINKKFSN